MTSELLQLEVRVDEPTGKPFICDQHGRRVAGVVRFVADVETAGNVATVNLTARLFSKGTKYVGSNNPRTEVPE